MKRSKFSLSNYKLLSCDMGELIPIGITEILPGDSVQQSTTCMVRLSPLLAPVMHPTHINISHWFVPLRIIWDDFEKFITGGPDGNDNTEPPYKNMGAVSVGSLDDYLGIPPATYSPTVKASSLPYRAYALIWNEWFRDQDLQAEAALSRGNGPDGTTAINIQNVNWEKDYFTTARPWEQKGPSITIPIGSSATVKTNNGALVSGAQNPMNLALTTTGAAMPSGITLSGTASGSISAGTGAVAAGTSTYPNNLYADLTGASAVTINLLREAFALQRFEEARARFGSRYVEYLRYLGVRSSDARLQRPEFLGGGRYPVQFSEVLQTAEGSDPVGELRGHGIGVARSNRYRRFFEEHGIVMTLMSVKPKTIYASGLPRMWTRWNKEDYFQKELQHIGQQEVLNKEVYMAHSVPDGTFGYQDRYDEYRRQESTIAGEFRTTLKHWHFARQFSSDPALNSTFVKSVPTENPFAVPAADVLYIMAKHSIQARRIVAGSAQSFIY